MQIYDRIDALNNRAASLNLSLWRVCKLAGVDYSTVARWRNSECNPTIVRFAEITHKVEQQIEFLERDMAMKMIHRINPVAAPRIAELLQQTPNAGGPNEALAQDQARDSRESTGNAGYPDGPIKAGGSDRAA